jgi:cell division protein FtsB
VSKLNGKIAKRDEKITGLEAAISELEKEVKNLKSKSKK